MRAHVPINTPAQIAMSRRAAQLAADVLAMLVPHVKAGVTTDELDQRCNDYIVNVQKAIPANVGYHGFPKTVCASVNEVVCHGIPSSRVLKDGDIVNLDIAVIKDGWFGDTSRMYCVGEPSPAARHLIKTTYQALCAGIEVVRPGATLGDIGHAIQRVAEAEGAVLGALADDERELFRSLLRRVACHAPVATEHELGACEAVEQMLGDSASRQ